MGQRSFDETFELERELEPLRRTRTIQEARLEALLESERGRIASEIVEALDASLAARGYRRAQGSGAEHAWAVDGADASQSVVVSSPSGSEATLRVRHGARDGVAFTIDHPSFAALAPGEQGHDDPASLEAASSPSLGDLSHPPGPFRSPQEDDHRRYHARVAGMRADIAEASQAIAELGLAISSFEAGGPYRFVSEGGDRLETVEAMLDAMLEA